MLIEGLTHKLKLSHISTNKQNYTRLVKQCCDLFFSNKQKSPTCLTNSENDKIQCEKRIMTNSENDKIQCEKRSKSTNITHAFKQT